MDLAINGGKPVRKKLFPVSGNITGRALGKEEVQLLKEVIKSGALNRNAGTKVKLFEKKFARYMKMKHCVMSTSGTAAIHIALGAIKINPGDEVITSPITDMGTIMPILLQNAVPVFYDVDLSTYTADVDSIARQITKRTKAIIPVHLTGAPCDMAPIMKLAKKHKLYVIEDCAQSYDAEYNGKRVGQIGHMACFSLNQYKQITSGDGGMTVTNNSNLARRALLFADKGWPRGTGGRDHLFLGPNYRVTELQAAVALAQLKKLPWVVRQRRKNVKLLEKHIRDLPLIDLPRLPKNSKSSYMFYAFRVDSKIRDRFVNALNAEGIPASAGYLAKPVYLYDVLAKKKTYGTTHYPFDCPHCYSGKIEYKKGLCPQAEELLRQMICIGWNEFYTEKDVKDIAKAIEKVALNFNRNLKC